MADHLLGHSEDLITAETILAELEQARLLALKMLQPGTMVAASTGRAKIAGLVVDKKEVGAPNEFDNMSDDELGAFISQKAEALNTPIGSGPRQYFVD
jgi:hypothetical protein